MPKGIKGFQKGYHPANEFKKGYHPKTEFKKGHKTNLGKHGGGRKKGYIVLEKTKEKIRKKLIGTKQSEETKKKKRKAMKGKKKSFRTEEHIRKIREWHINNPNKKFKDTKIELKIEDELKRRDINYEKQIPLCKIAIVDFYLPEYRVVIQCDGCYWHGCPIHYPNKHIERKEIDDKQDRILTFNGFNVYRFWEHEINENVQECIDKLNF